MPPEQYPYDEEEDDYEEDDYEEDDEEDEIDGGARRAYAREKERRKGAERLVPIPLFSDARARAPCVFASARSRDARDIGGAGCPFPAGARARVYTGRDG